MVSTHDKQMSRFHAQFVGELDATYMSYRPSPAHDVRTRADISLLSISDRAACLHILERARVCTATQLANLIYPSVRTALRRSRKLWLNSLVTRESLPVERGGIPVAYRLSASGRRRIHLNAYRSPGLMTARHSLDGVELASSLVRHDPGLAQLWWTEWLVPDIGAGVNPDQLVVIDTGEASALILVEVDESTERPPVIRERLTAYAKLFEDHHVGWHLLWVTNSPERLARLRQIAGPMRLASLAGRCWGASIGEVSELGANAEVLAVGASQAPRPLRELATDLKARRTSHPVGSPAWVRLLANGGREDIGALWRGIERQVGESVEARAPVASTSTAERPQPPVEKQLAAADRSRTESLKTPQSPTAAVRPFGLEDMASTELAVLITARDRNEQQVFEAATVIAARRAWGELDDAAEILCRSYESDEQLLGLRLVRRYQGIDPTMRHALTGLVRHLARRGEANVAAMAQSALEEMTGGS